jgi:hypothetical protein
MRRSSLLRLTLLAFCAIGLTGTASAYFYYVHYDGLGGPYAPVYEKFDLTRLYNNTVPFYVSDQPPATFSSGDSYQGVISELRSASNIWNGLASSQIRLAYGGLFTVGTTETAPGIDIEFSDDIPPGLLALSGPSTRADVSTAADGTVFVPILRSKMLLPNDLSQFPSFGELFFTTVVHEFGHTMGLQHTLTSSVMSTAITSASTKATPLGPDDIAAVSLLYPAANYLSTVGSITGQVTMNGTGVNLASVVAISPSNAAISALTRPDGTFEIDGVPPGQYYIYVHPLPPPEQGESTPDNIVFPCGTVHDVCSGNSSNFIPPNYSAFATQFYPGTQDWTKASAVFVYAANTTNAINFAVNARSSEAVSGVRTYGYSQTNVAIPSAPLNVGSFAPLVAAGSGLLQSNGSLVPGLNISVLGTAAQISDLNPYPSPNPYGYVYMYLLVNFAAGPGPKHLLFQTPGDLYVLPAGFTVVDNPPPGITSITPGFDSNGNRLLTVVGTTFNQNTSIWFDGLPGTIQSFDGNQTITVTPPEAPSGYTANVVALNTDGQSSLFLQGSSPMTYTYDPSAPASLVITPDVLPQGNTTTVDVVGVNTNFIDGQTSVGFGTSDILVTSISVLSPTHFTAVASPNVSMSTNGISVTTGLNILSGALGTPVTALPPQRPPKSN